MMQVVAKWFRITYNKVIISIAFLPAIIAVSFLLLSFGMIAFDFSATGKNIKANLHWLSLKDASTARSICSAIAGGIISLAVFSFSMVMILLNQAASQMSNRILGKLIGNRFQQVVLGFYIGTIVYALFLLSTIRDINSGIYVPAISTYLLIALTVADIFLFIYFLHYITESIKFETIIHKIYNNTKEEMKKSCMLDKEPEASLIENNGRKINAHASGLYQGFDKDSLLASCEKEDVIISFIHPVGTYLMEGIPLLTVTNKEEVSKGFEKKLGVIINIDRGQEISTSYYYGLQQLMEIAIKALSPGINDPGTAVISLHAIADLLAYKLHHFSEIYLKDKEGFIRIITKEKTFKEIFTECILPIWDYGKNDRSIQREMLRILMQLKMKGEQPVINTLLQSVQAAIKND